MAKKKSSRKPKPLPPDLDAVGLFAGLPEALRKSSFAVAIVNPRSRNFPVVVEYLKQAQYYNAITLDSGDTYFGAVFDARLKSVAYFMEICDFTMSWQSARYYRNMLPLPHISDAFRFWFRCYVTSLSSHDLMAHCCSIDKAWRGDWNMTIACPCQVIHGWTQFALDPDNQAIPLATQYRSFALKKSVTDCPCFSMENFRVLSIDKTWPPDADDDSSDDDDDPPTPSLPQVERQLSSFFTRAIGGSLGHECGHE